MPFALRNIERPKTPVVRVGGRCGSADLSGWEAPIHQILGPVWSPHWNLSGLPAANFPLFQQTKICIS